MATNILFHVDQKGAIASGRNTSSSTARIPIDVPTLPEKIRKIIADNIRTNDLSMPDQVILDGHGRMLQVIEPTQEGVITAFENIFTEVAEEKKQRELEQKERIKQFTQQFHENIEKEKFRETTLHISPIVDGVTRRISYTKYSVKHPDIYLPGNVELLEKLINETPAYHKLQEKCKAMTAADIAQQMEKDQKLQIEEKNEREECEKREKVIVDAWLTTASDIEKKMYVRGLVDREMMLKKILHTLFDEYYYETSVGDVDKVRITTERFARYMEIEEAALATAKSLNLDVKIEPGHIYRTIDDRELARLTVTICDANESWDLDVPLNVPTE
jgi:hypothetical protein